MLICPICKENLEKLDRTYTCKNNHSFDISKSSHINLLKSNKNGDNIGDNKDMVKARSSFLDKDYYRPLADKICELLPDKKAVTYLDCGCGQGYYTKIVAEFLKSSSSYATDISKNAVIHASKRDKKTTYFVGSVFDLPVKEKSVDIITCIFSPLALDEFERVIKPNGNIFIVVAGDNHLFELKEAVYANAYKNDENKHDFDGFEVVSKEKITYKTVIKETEDIKNLFQMTPYSLKTSREDKLKLDSLSDLEITFDFVIYTLKSK